MLIAPGRLMGPARLPSGEMSASAAALLASSGLGSESLIYHGDWANDRHWLMGRAYGAYNAVPGLTYTRSGSRFATNNAGVLVPFAANIPRITDRGIRIESGLTNYGTFPALGSGWAASSWSFTISASSIVSPDGQLAHKLVRDNSGVAGRQPRVSAMPVTAGDVVTTDIYIAGADGITTGIVGIYATNGWGLAANSTAEIVSGPGTLNNVQPSMWRVEGLSEVALTRLRIRRTITEGDGATADLYYYAHTSSAFTASAGVIGSPVMFYKGSVPGADPVPNAAPSTAAAVVADSLYITGLDHNWPVTLFAEVELLTGFSAAQIVMQYDATSIADRVFNYRSVANSFRGITTAVGVNTSDTGNRAITAPLIARVVSRHADKVRLAITGLAAVEGAAGAVPLGLNRLLIGQAYTGGSASLEGYLKSVALFAGAPSDAALDSMVVMP